MIFLLFFSSFSLANESLCVNKDIALSNGKMLVAKGEYTLSEKDGRSSYYRVQSEGVESIKVSSTIQYNGKQNFCLISSDGEKFCGLIKTSGKKIKPFEKCSG